MWCCEMTSNRKADQKSWMCTTKVHSTVLYYPLPFFEFINIIIGNTSPTSSLYKLPVVILFCDRSMRISSIKHSALFVFNIIKYFVNMDKWIKINCYHEVWNVLSVFFGKYMLKIMSIITSAPVLEHPLAP